MPEWAEVRSAEGIDRTATPDFGQLDPGEEEALLLALSLRADLLLMDDSEGRRTAQEQGLKVRGTLGILVAASAQGWIDLPDAITALRETSFQISETLLQAALQQDRHLRESSHHND